MTSQVESAPARSWPLKAAIGLLLAGVGIAAYLVYVKLRLGYDETFVSACNFGGKLNCDAVQTHPASDVFGLPLALYAIPTYLVMAFLALKGHASRAAVAVMAGIGTLTVLHSIYLAGVSATQIGAFCLFCISMYAVNLGSTVLAIAAHGAGLGGVFRDLLGGLSTPRGPALSAAIVLLVTGAASYFGYEQGRTHMLEQRQARIAAQFQQVEPPPSGADTPTAMAAQPGTAAQPGAAQAPQQPAQPAAPAAPPTPKLTENGWDYFEVPVDPQTDYVTGPDDAKVTVVTVKDFECGFCRFLSYQTKPLETKYKDKVRFVFKHYPMNGDCNYRMGGARMHEGACRSAYAAHCAWEQGKFKEMHDELYQNQPRFSDADLRGYAEKIGLDLARYDECLKSDRPKQKVDADVRLAARMRINGTPRVYVNNRLVTGSVATDVLDYYIQMAEKYPVAPPAAEAKAATAETPTMVQMRKASGSFWIDAFEASIDAQGRAVSVPNVKPALASWFEAKAACEKAGKRLCTEEEWVSACIGEPATDANNNGNFTDGEVTGRMYPYGAFYEKGACRESEDKYKGEAGPTGGNPGCRTPEGVYDLAGNLYEWVGADPKSAAMMGGDWRSETSATCRRRTTTYGAGIKNDTTGFRCCADSFVQNVAGADQVKDTTIEEIVGKGVPQDLVLDTVGGGKLDPNTFKGKVTYLTFFASWCGNCRKQMPAIKGWQDEWAAKGFQVVAINVDREPARGQSYISELDPNFMVALDPMARTMSDFDINAMPTSFIIGKDGIIKKRVVGYIEKEIPQTRATIESLLGG